VDSVKSREQLSNTAGSMKQEDYTYWLHLCKTSVVVRKLYNTDHAAKLYFVNTRLCGVHDGETEATLRLFGDAVWFQTCE
jgi:hypothetical protein